MINYYSIHGELIKEYIEFKRSLGYLFKVEYAFKQFDDFLEANNIKEINLSRNILDLWSKKRPNESDVTRYKRVNNVRNYLLFLNNYGYSPYIPRQIKNYHSDFTPYIFSDKEISDFFKACDSLKITNTTTSAYIYPLLFRILYGCGLRINEALNLKIEDVNLETNCLYISKSKNGGDRLIPFDQSLKIIITKYMRDYRNTLNKTEYLFVKTDCTKCKSGTAYEWFRKILHKAKISHGGRGKGPRLHDFRHTFSVYSLIKMSRNNLDLYYALPILSRYLGHKSIEATEKYVRLTQTMYPEIIENINKICPDLLTGGE